MGKITEVVVKMFAGVLNLTNKLTKFQKMLLVSILSFVILVLLIWGVVPSVRANIRNNEIQSIANSKLTDDKNFLAIDNNDVRKLIMDKDEVTVMFVNPNSANLERLEKAIDEQKETTYSFGKIYVYPLVYDLKKEQKFFHLSSDITAIRFVKQEEVNRVSFNQPEELELYFVDYLAHLNEQAIASPPVTNESTTESSTNMTSETSGNEIIDELENSGQ